MLSATNRAREANSNHVAAVCIGSPPMLNMGALPHYGKGVAAICLNCDFERSPPPRVNQVHAARVEAQTIEVNGNFGSEAHVENGGSHSSWDASEAWGWEGANRAFVVSIDFAHSLRQHGTTPVDGDGGWRPARGSERVRIWRDQFPYRIGGTHSAQTYRERQAFGGGRRGAAIPTRADPARGAYRGPGTAKCRPDTREGASARGAGDRRRLRG